jgi:hypothetical protein
MPVASMPALAGQPPRRAPPPTVTAADVVKGSGRAGASAARTASPITPHSDMGYTPTTTTTTTTNSSGTTATAAAAARGRGNARSAAAEAAASATPTPTSAPTSDLLQRFHETRAATQRYRLSDLKGHVVEFSRDQVRVCACVRGALCDARVVSLARGSFSSSWSTRRRSRSSRCLASCWRARCR